MINGSARETVTVRQGPEPTDTQPFSSPLWVHGLGFWRPMPKRPASGKPGEHADGRLEARTAA